jgi:hypothetical protein
MIFLGDSFMTRVSVLFLFPLITLAAANPIALSNVGYFCGSGFSIQLAKTEQVQLVSEVVKMHPRREADSPLGGGWVTAAPSS